MSYCTITDVQALNAKRTYSATSTPTTTQVTGFIDSISAEIDMILMGRGLDVPATSPTALVSFLKAVNAYGAGSLAESSMFPESVEKGATPHWKILEQKYQDWLKLLKEGNISDLQGDLSGSLYTNSETDQDNYPEPSFTNEMVF